MLGVVGNGDLVERSWTKVYISVATKVKEQDWKGEEGWTVG